MFAVFELYLYYICIVFVWRAGRVESIGEIPDVVTGGNITGNGQLHHHSSNFLDFWMGLRVLKIYEIWARLVLVWR